MSRRRVTIAAAAAGVLTGVAGLGVLAMPAGAGPAPVLPDVDAQSLVESVLTASPAAFGGTVEVNNDLGVPAISGVPQLSDGTSSVRMWTDGQERVRVSLPGSQTERTFVDDGENAWLWNSADQTVTKYPHSAAPEQERQPGEQQLDPVAAAREAVALVEESSDVAVDGTARVAGRAAYELVLTPKPTERTVLREVRVAVDAELRIPLRFSVFTNGTAEPAAQIAFSELNVGPQDAGLFTFTPPAGATVEEGTKDAEDAEEPTREEAEKAFGEAAPQVVGDGWDTVLVVKAPLDAVVPQDAPEDSPSERGPRQDGEQFDPRALLAQLGKPVSGDWGSGTLITTRVGAAVVADDGRVALGAVPEQVLVEALGQAK
jgi:outer membrane lipoprotein-sorting protein